VTLKDQFAVTGLDTTITYTASCGQPATVQSALVDVLESLGAIVIAKTTLPQSIMWGETSSPLFGLTTNPRNRGFTPGGSTGGEAVLLAMNGSPLGWGTDIGGSVRIPSAMCGTAGFKPSNSRLPYKGVAVSDDGQEHVPSAIGPMARTVEGLVMAMKAVLAVDLSRIDPRVVPIKWREEDYQSMFGRKLRIGVIRDDGVVRVHPPVARALQEAVEKLQKAGHEVVEWTPDHHVEAMEIINRFWTADGGEDIRSAIEAGGEPFLPQVESLVNEDSALSVFEYWQLNRRKWRLQEAYCAKWNASGSLTSTGQEVDLLLTPAMGHVAVPHNCYKWVGYTKVWNVLDYPAGVFGVDAVSEEQDRITEEWKSYQPRNKADDWNWKLCK
jgi:amidase